MQLTAKQDKPKLAVLIDPAKESLETARNKAIEAESAGVDYLFVGGSLTGNETEVIVVSLKSSCNLPVVLFPGNILQITDKADSLLLLSLISGRNPEMLIGRHVTAAPLLRKTSLEIVPVGYMLIDGGKQSSVEYISGSRPIPADKADIASATALAGEMLGLKMIYLEAGSGALNPVSPKLIAEVRKHVNIPIIVGGGIRQPEQAKAAYQAGADLVIVGNVFEKENPGIKAFVQALNRK
jgi:putative glycerol-1-phosphate prenyltransferase